MYDQCYAKIFEEEELPTTRYMSKYPKRKVIRKVFGEYEVHEYITASKRHPDGVFESRRSAQ